MLTAWHRTDKNMDIPKRTATMIQESAHSMTITSLTNMISFGTGVFSSTLALQTFAIYSTAANAICYFYQLVIFPALLTLTAYRECRKGNDSVSGCLPEELRYMKYAGEFHDRAWKFLARLVVKPWMKLLTVLTVQIPRLLLIFAVCSMSNGDSEVEMQTLAIVVTTPGDLRDPKRLTNVTRMIRDYELAAYRDSGLGQITVVSGDRTNFMKVAFTYVHIPDFINSEISWKGTMRVNETACALNQPSCLSSFLFITGFTTLSGYREMIPLVQGWRAISKKYPELGVYAYTERSDYVDQSAEFGAVIGQMLFSAVICMGIAFIVFIPDVVSIAAAMFSLLSVNLGVSRLTGYTT
ncbi:hypothetical protein GCK32_002062 [Trichostrongylus colubriformis]|uniref:SSD domain-containing protein n=2 Tax=Trichostrongylus colubriformis TaxID=6319 RepID=A0AAN8F502_TRICO